jgi:hypothetical protein
VSSANKRLKEHKHLGITFSEEAKWNTHVENLIKSVSKHICVLRKLKYKINRQNLEKLNLIYIRPISEYACEVWDNCHLFDQSPSSCRS